MYKRLKRTTALPQSEITYILCCLFFVKVIWLGRSPMKCLSIKFIVRISCFMAESLKTAPGAHIFCRINIRNMSTKIFVNLSDSFGKIYLNFHYTCSYMRQNSPAPGGHVFQPINIASRNLIVGHPKKLMVMFFNQTKWPEVLIDGHLRNISTKFIWKSANISIAMETRICKDNKFIYSHFDIDQGYR